MTGSNLVLFVVPLVMLPALGVWLGLCYHAGAHPEWKSHRLAREALAREALAREALAREALAREALTREALTREARAQELAAAVTADQVARQDAGQPGTHPRAA